MGFKGSEVQILSPRPKTNKNGGPEKASGSPFFICWALTRLIPDQNDSFSPPTFPQTANIAIGTKHAHFICHERPSLLFKADEQCDLT
jgi:hypothetical protein